MSMTLRQPYPAPAVIFRVELSDSDMAWLFVKPPAMSVQKFLTVSLNGAQVLNFETALATG